MASLAAFPMMMIAPSYMYEETNTTTVAAAAAF